MMFFLSLFWKSGVEGRLSVRKRKWMIFVFILVVFLKCSWLLGVVWVVMVCDLILSLFWNVCWIMELLGFVLLLLRFRWSVFRN